MDFFLYGVVFLNSLFLWRATRTQKKMNQHFITNMKIQGVFMETTNAHLSSLDCKRRMKYLKNYDK